MTIIRPFRGLLYNRKAVGNLAKVITPPYDVITPRQQVRYYKSHPKNFIRIDLGKTSKKDSASNNRYTRARGFFERWIKEGVFTKDDASSIYVYSQEYKEAGRRKARLGFISLAKLEEDRTKGFLPHERTFSGPKMDRFRLMKEVKANLSPIFSIVFDDNKKIMQILKDVAYRWKPILDVEFEGTRNKIWRMSDEGLITKLSRAIRNKRALIADGHHRYEVALEYRRYMLKTKKEAIPGAYDYVMMYFATSDPAGLTILPTHRMVAGISTVRLRKNLDKLNKYFDIIETGSRYAMFSCMKAGRKRHAIGVYLGGRDYMCLRLKRKDAGAFIDSKNSSCWRNLDVVILHHLVFEKALGIKGHGAEKAITFTRDAEEAFDWTASGIGRVSFFLNPPDLKDINNIVKRQERMPHKTTYFYPKPPSGLVINKLE